MGWAIENYKGHENLFLLQAMDRLGIGSAKALSVKAGISHGAASRMIRGAMYPRIDTALLVCKALNCSLDTIYPIDYTGNNC